MTERLGLFKAALIGVFVKTESREGVRDVVKPVENEIKACVER